MRTNRKSIFTLLTTPITKARARYTCVLNTIFFKVIPPFRELFYVYSPVKIDPIL